jgi:segregation and condensation protein B
MRRGASSAAATGDSLTPAQLETLAIVAYLQPVSRPEIARIRGVNAESPVATLLDRGLIEESRPLRVRRGPLQARRPLFLKLFDLASLEDLPDPATWDPTPEEEGELRDRLLAAGDARAGVAAE